MRTTRVRNNTHQVRLSQKIRKKNNLTILESKKIKGHKEDNKHLLR